jgi:uncharacterized protein (TIGR03067 family)
MRNRAHVGTLSGLPVIVAWLLVTIASSGCSRQDPERARLVGTWNAVEVENGGQPATPQEVQLTRFVFALDHVRVRGNSADGRDEYCEYRLDTSTDPHQIDLLPATLGAEMHGIYRFHGDRLEIVLRQHLSDRGRPDSFEVGEDRELSRVVLKRMQ